MLWPRSGEIWCMWSNQSCTFCDVTMKMSWSVDGRNCRQYCHLMLQNCKTIFWGDRKQSHVTFRPYVVNLQQISKVGDNDTSRRFFKMPPLWPISMENHKTIFIFVWVRRDEPNWSVKLLRNQRGIFIWTSRKCPNRQDRKEVIRIRPVQALDWVNMQNNRCPTNIKVRHLNGNISYRCGQTRLQMHPYVPRSHFGKDSTTRATRVIANHASLEDSPNWILFVGAPTFILAWILRWTMNGQKEALSL